MNVKSNIVYACHRSFVEKMSALAYRSALGQLKSLKQFLATNVMYQDKKALELVMIVSIAYQVSNDGYIQMNDMLNALFYL